MKNSSILRLTHNVLVSAFIGLMITILEHHSLLNWLDSISLRMSLSIKQEVDELVPNFVLSKNASKQAINTAAILINNEAFEGVFNQQSPLNKKTLADLLQKISAKSPKVIAVDIDLSPARNNQDEIFAQNELDQLLIQLVSQNIGVVLVNPFPVEDDELRLIKYQWMSKLCRSDVHFAYPNISISQGVALRYSPDYLSLGMVSSQVTKNKVLNDPNNICGLVNQGIERAIFLDATFGQLATQHSVNFSQMMPVLPDVIRSIFTSAYRWYGDSKDILDSIPSGVVIFLGGEFDPRDNFLTVQGQVPGVVFHAAVQVTDSLGIKKLSRALAFVFNFILGIIAGYLFNWAWTRQNQSMLSKLTTDGNYWIKYLKARAWLLINIVILLSWIILLFSFTASLLKAQLWANPIAMIIGVFIKTMTSSRKGLEEHSFISRQSDWSKLDAVTLTGDLILTAPVIIYGVYLTFFK